MKNLNVIEQLQSLLQQAQQNELDEKPLDFDSARQFLGVSSSTLYKMTFQKKIPFSKPGGKKVYFKKSDLIKWMNSNPVKTAEEIDEEVSSYLMKK